MDSGMIVNSGSSGSTQKVRIANNWRGCRNAKGIVPMH